MRYVVLVIAVCAASVAALYLSPSWPVFVWELAVFNVLAVGSWTIVTRGRDAGRSWGRIVGFRR